MVAGPAAARSAAAAASTPPAVVSVALVSMVAVDLAAPMAVVGSQAVAVPMVAEVLVGPAPVAADIVRAFTLAAGSLMLFHLVDGLLQVN